MRTWYAYEVDCVDVGWEYQRTVKETAAFFDQQVEGPYAGEGKRLHRAYEEAVMAAKAIGFDGTLRQDPVVFWFPNPPEFQYGFIIKQENNGQTFVVVPVPMFGLETLRYS